MVGGVAGISGAGGISGVYGVAGYPRLYGASAGRALLAGRAAAPETPVQPAKAVPTATVREARPMVYSERLPSEFSAYSMPVLPSSYAAEQANRARVEYPQSQAAAGGEGQGQQHLATIAQQGHGAAGLPGWPGANAAETLVRMRIQYGPEGQQQAQETGAVGAQEALEEGKCETCEQRKYQDGSDDSSVSYQTPTRIDPDMAASAVRGHEMEHVSHEQAKAQQEGRKVVRQTVTLHTGVCPECGKAYVSGGTTRTVTKAETEQPAQQEGEEEQSPAAA